MQLSFSLTVWLYLLRYVTKFKNCIFAIPPHLVCNEVLGTWAWKNQKHFKTLCCACERLMLDHFPETLPLSPSLPPSLPPSLSLLSPPPSLSLSFLYTTHLSCRLFALSTIPPVCWCSTYIKCVKFSALLLLSYANPMCNHTHCTAHIMKFIVLLLRPLQASA